MKFSELRRKRRETPITVPLEDGTEVEVFVPSVEGVRKVHLVSAEIQEADKDDKNNREGINRAAELVGWMLIACSPNEEMSIQEAEQAIYDTGGPTGPLALKVTELIYSKNAVESMTVDPTSSGDASESTPTN